MSLKIRVEKICPSCNKRFLPKKPGQVYCGLFCRNRHPGFLIALKKQKRKCVECEKEFGPNVYNQIYCSKNCMEINYRKRCIEKTGMLICSFCGKQIIPSMSRAYQIISGRNILRKTVCSRRCSVLSTNYSSMNIFLKTKEEWKARQKVHYCLECGKKEDLEKKWHNKSNPNRIPGMGNYCSRECAMKQKRANRKEYDELQIRRSLKNMARIVRNYFKQNIENTSDYNYAKFLKSQNILFIKHGGKISIRCRSCIINTKNKKLLHDLKVRYPTVKPLAIAI